MNCKPNQLARIIANKETMEVKLADKIIRTVEVGPLESGLPGWTFEGPPLRITCPCGCGTVAFIDRVADEVLRPIENPGNDVKDNATEFQPPLPVFKGDWVTA